MNRRHKTNRKIERVIAYMFAHVNKPLTATQLAKQANLSTSYFSAFFKQKTGYAPMDFFIRLRMRCACYLLNSTNEQVKDIASALGYKDPLYFSRLFKVVYGIAPTEYRIAWLNRMLLYHRVDLACPRDDVVSCYPRRSAEEPGTRRLGRLGQRGVRTRLTKRLPFPSRTSFLSRHQKNNLEQKPQPSHRI